MLSRLQARTLLLTAVALFSMPFISNTQHVKASVTPPLAAFTYNPCVMCMIPGDAVFFNANTSLAQGGRIVSYTWNFGDGSQPLKTNSSLATHVFSNTLPGRWTVTLTVTDSYGGTDTISQLVLFNVAPDFSIKPGHPFVQEPLSFNASTTRIYQGSLPAGPRFIWSFGDGTNGTGVLTVHSYNAPGPYRVALTVATSQGDPTITRIILVGLSPPNGQELQLSFKNFSITISATINVNSTTRSISATISLIATNATDGTVAFSSTVNLTISYGPDHPPRFLVAITSTPRLAASCTVDPSTARLNCLVSKNPDIACHGRVDIVDFSIVAYDYGATRGTPRYNPAADLADSGVIDMVDIGIVSLDYGSPIY